MRSHLFSRRRMIAGGAALIGTGLLASKWNVLASAQGYAPLMRFADGANMRLQRLAIRKGSLVPEYRPDQISPFLPQTGGFGSKWAEPDPGYFNMVKNGFRDWRLAIDGLVDRPLRLSLDELKSMPDRTQITMHCCDEGWSAIAKWTGVPLRFLLELAGLKDSARYVVFHCMDRLVGQNMWGSIDLHDAFHPQTMIAHGLNGASLPVAHGAPVRLRVELQIGYKNLKHIDRITVTDSLKKFGLGNGGLVEDFGYQWYAGL